MKIRVDKLDVLFSKFIRLRAKNHCERCGAYKEKGLQCCHFHSRRKHSVRYDEDNACALDFGCHQYLDSHPLEKIEFFKKRLGNIGFDMLNHRANQPKKPDKKLLALYFQGLMKEVEK